MQKKVIRSIALFLMLSLVLSATAIAMDARASSRFKRYSAELSAGNDGNVYVLFSVTASSTMDIIGASSITIQRYDDAQWVTECILTVKDEPRMQTTDAARYSASISYKPISYKPISYNTDYRAVVTVYAKDSSGSSTAQTIAE